MTQLDRLKKYVLTGGPGSGKTSILRCLELRHNEHIIRESAEDYVLLRQAEGEPKPWEEPGFQSELTRIRVYRESVIPKDIKRVFIDRGIVDGLAYSGNPESREMMLELLKDKIYDKIFMIESLGHIESTNFRHEDLERSMELERKLRELYTGMGYEIVNISSAPLQDRVNLLLENIS